MLLIVGGNDTTRNSITGGVLALNQNPDEYAKLRANPGADPEHGAGDHPLADAAGPHAPHRAGRTPSSAASTINEGDKVVMWYVSGNRDEEAIEQPERFIIDRARPRQHLSFGFGIHRCVGNRLAELQLTILWEEILKRFPTDRGGGRAEARLSPPSCTASRDCRCASRPDRARRAAAGRQGASVIRPTSASIPDKT